MWSFIIQQVEFPARGQSAPRFLGLHTGRHIVSSTSFFWSKPVRRPAYNQGGEADLTPFYVGLQGHIVKDTKRGGDWVPHRGLPEPSARALGCLCFTEHSWNLIILCILILQCIEIWGDIIISTLLSTSFLVRSKPGGKKKNLIPVLFWGENFQ